MSGLFILILTVKEEEKSVDAPECLARKAINPWPALTQFLRR